MKYFNPVIKLIVALVALIGMTAIGNISLPIGALGAYLIKQYKRGLALSMALTIALFILSILLQDHNLPLNLHNSTTIMGSNSIVTNLLTCIFFTFIGTRIGFTVRGLMKKKTTS